MEALIVLVISVVLMVVAEKKNFYRYNGFWSHMIKIAAVAAGGLVFILIAA